VDKVYRVFVSSTYSDLKDERRQVSETLSKAGFFPTGMELFPAADQEQLEFIQRVIDACDYYVVIVGGRYGSLADENVSFTEKEYEYALSKGLPVLAFLHGEPERIEIGKSEIEPDKASRLKAFRDRLSTGRLVRSWRNVSELCGEVLISLINESNRSPGVGWVRGDQAIDPRVLQEAERLRIENAELKRRLVEAAQDDLRFPEDLKSPDTEFLFPVEIQKYGINRQGYEYIESKVKHELTAVIGEVFSVLFDRLLYAPTEIRLKRSIGAAVVALAAPELRAEKTHYEVPLDVVTALRFHFEALGLIQSTAGKGSLAWSITDKGRRYVTHGRAMLKSE
jgi:hypothetical protein